MASLRFNNHCPNYPRNGQPDDDETQRLKTEILVLRGQLKSQSMTRNFLRQSHSKLRAELNDSKAKNQQLKDNSIEQEKNIKRMKDMFLNLRNEHEIRRELAEKELISVKNENQQLMGKLSSCFERELELEQKVLRNEQIVLQKCHEIENLNSAFKDYSVKWNDQNRELMNVRQQLKSLETMKVAQADIIQKNSEYMTYLVEKVREGQILRKGHARENWQLRGSLTHTHNEKIMLEEDRKTMEAEFTQKQNEVKDILEERNQLVEFVQEVQVQLGNDDYSLQNNLPQLLYILKVKLGIIHSSNQQAARISVTSLPPPSTSVTAEADCIVQDDDEQLYDQHTSNIILNTQMPHTSPSTPQPPTRNTCLPAPPPPKNSSADELYNEIMCNVEQSVIHSIPSTSTNCHPTGVNLPAQNTKLHFEITTPEQRPGGGGRGGNGAKYFCHCGERSTSKRRLKTHIQQHDPDRKFVCDICSKRFLKLGNLKKHKDTHKLQALENLLFFKSGDVPDSRTTSGA